MMQSEEEQTTQLAGKLLAGSLSLEEFTQQVMAMRYSSTSLPEKTKQLRGTSLDLERRKRCGFPEVIYGAGKTSEQIAEIISALVTAQEQVLVTRLNEEKSEQLVSRFPEAIYNKIAKTLRLDPTARLKSKKETPAKKNGQKRGCVAVITAGTSDLNVAQEACETLHWMGVGVTLVEDVGVAGPHRLGERLAEFSSADAIVVVAGMEGALPSIVGGYVACPVIGVPTSVGYGACLNGLTPLLGMLSSCASNVAVVNIDAGFKAGYMAGLITTRRHEGE